MHSYIAKAYKDLQKEMKNADENLSFFLTVRLYAHHHPNLLSQLFDEKLVTRKKGSFLVEWFRTVKNVS